ncbi:TRAP transporter substrate-binding protein [Caenimonas sedimenti]|uniref:TRAP transporter substrate-binding protein n=1 Tax=Caenimonas sedimenti TaxID=2596921 RepID=A0A562ZTU7_9BURK|nr:TRAP transporter substrate-binding protein [Caenimonas sedimenti]TWO72032.1 TRAP transporter substrate-binding protein [Caenimonas sedimenti]
MKSILCAAALAAVVASPCLAQPSIQWKLATGYRAESFHTQNIEAFASEVASATRGQLKIEVAPNNSLVKLPEIPAAVAAGKVQAGEAIMSGMGKDVPLAGADGVPFVVGTYEAVQRMWTLQRPGIERDFAKRGLKPLYAVPWPPQGLYTNKPIREARDLQGLKMRTYNPTTVRIAELLGSVPVDVAMVQVGTALKEGRMDAMITSAVTGVENKVWGGLTHYYELNAWFPKNIVFVNAKAFDALPAATRKVVLESAARAEARGFALSQEAAHSATVELRRNGIKVEPVPFELSRDLKRLGEKFSREWVASVGNAANEIFIPFYDLK